MKKTLSLMAMSLIILSANAQTSPEIISWIQNKKGETGYGNIPSNVQKVQYSDSFVYVSVTCVPSYKIGPWTGNPNVAKNQNLVFKMKRYPTQNTGKPVMVPMGHTGIWSNGVTVFNSMDAMSYNNKNTWHQDAVVVEGKGFDSCLGHPQMDGEYHHHLNPRCLYNDKDSSKHSPIIGYAFDGFPIYGAYGYANPNDTSSKITRMTSTFRLRSITKRTTRPDGSSLNASEYGPDVNSTYPLGYYIEDYEIVKGYGKLGPSNGRFCKTPEYPNGTFAYFVTIDSATNGVFPYTPGIVYYGTPQAEDVGMGSGNVKITETVKTYTITSIENANSDYGYKVYPNPTNGTLNLQFLEEGLTKNSSVEIYSMTGQLILKENLSNATQKYSFDMSSYPAGLYRINVINAESTSGKMISVVR
ncbi:MAG: YHYH protein [Bacteroidetes bacterium]|nr:YHYH protein [Bacteroidota bacterium]